jgi:beta-N-acetylhexosaminidase
MRKLLLLGLAVLTVVGLTAFVSTQQSASLEVTTALPGEASEAPVAGEPAAPGTPSAAPAPTVPPCTPASLEQRAAQTLVVGMPGVRTGQEPLAQELMQMGVGGVLLQRPNIAGAEQVKALVGTLRAANEVPLLVTTDEEPGRVSAFRPILGKTSSARTLGSTQTPEQIQAFARRVGEGLAALGVDLDLAPVADLDAGDPGGIVGDRSFSPEPALATDAALAFSEGLREAGVLATVKHFPGHGLSAVDSHINFSRVDVGLEEIRGSHLAPFVAQIERGVPVVMLSHVGYGFLSGDKPASLDPKAYQLLRDLGFQGVAMTDALGMGAVNLTYPYPVAAVEAMAAGADALLATDGKQARAMRDAIVAAVRDGRIPESRVDEAAARMLVLKGADPRLLTCSTPQPTAMAAAVHQMGPIGP